VLIHRFSGCRHPRASVLTFPFRIANALFFAALFAAALAAVSQPARAAELVMFEDAGCMWCARFNAEIGPIYPKTEEGQRAPLRRVDMGKAVPGDLAFIETERFTPLFVLVDQGREIGRIRGYPGEDHFWGLLGMLIRKLDEVGTGREQRPLN
jgi:hypothetical protein